MKKFTLSIALIICAGVLFSFGTSATAKPGGAVIVHPKDASFSERLAAKEIRRYLYLRTDELVDIRAADHMPSNDTPAIVVATRGAQIAKHPAVEASLKSLGPQEYVIKTAGKGAHPSVIIVGGDDIGTLYGAYHFLEKMGIRFNLHQDVIPDKKINLALPDVDETGKPLFELRGLNPWGAHAEGIDAWDADKYKAVFTQMTKMRMNAMVIHSYPEHSGYGTEPALWVGLPDDIDEQGNVLFSSPTSYWNTKRVAWGYRPTKTGDYLFGGSRLFETDDWGSHVLGGQFPAAVELKGRNEVFNRTGKMFNDAFTFARSLGVKTALGTEGSVISPWLIERQLKDGQKLNLAEHGPSWVIPTAVREHIKAQGKDPKDPAVLEDIYEGIFRRIKRTHPLDYYVLYSQEMWYWNNFDRQMFDLLIEEWEIAIRAWKKVDPEFGLAVCGWVLGPDFDHAAFDKVLPKHIAISEMSRAYNAPVDEGFGKMQDGRPRWAIPWIEEDSPILTPSLWAGRVRKDAADALAYGCTGFMTLHWRTKILEPSSAAMARACWDQSGWNPEFGKDKPGVPESTFDISEERSIEGPIRGIVADIGNLEITQTEDDRLYQTTRYDLKGYRLTVPNGRYKVVLRFCEPHFNAAGERICDVTLQGKTVLTDLDIHANVGKYAALDYTFDNIEVSDGSFHLGFIDRKSLPCIMAFDVIGKDYSIKINCGGGDYKDYISDSSFYFPTPTFMWGEGNSTFRARGLDVDDFYADWAKAMFGPEVATATAEFFSKLDGHIPLVADWAGANGGGAGGLAPDGRSWDDVSKEYAFVDEFEKLRPSVCGKGSLERFDYWLNNFRYARATGHAECVWGELGRVMNEANQQEDAQLRKAIAAKKVLPVYKELVSQVGEAYRLQLSTIGTVGGMQTILNWEGHNNLLNIRETYKRLSEMLEKDISDEVVLTKDYQGEPRLIVPTVRTLLNEGESLTLKVIILDNHPAKSAVFRWRPLGAGAYREIRLKHVARAVYSASLPAVAEDIEYYLKAETSQGKELIWPATAPEMNQTVVVQSL